MSTHEPAAGINDGGDLDDLAASAPPPREDNNRRRQRASLASTSRKQRWAPHARRDLL
jgi:hypothetical protein